MILWITMINVEKNHPFSRKWYDLGLEQRKCFFTWEESSLLLNKQFSCYELATFCCSIKVGDKMPCLQRSQQVVFTFAWTSLISSQWVTMNTGFMRNYYSINWRKYQCPSKFHILLCICDVLAHNVLIECHDILAYLLNWVSCARIQYCVTK